MRSAILVVVALAACGDNIHPAVDARPIDSARIDAPVDGPCAVGRQVTGELVDLDSTPGTLAGINGAVFTQRAGTATDTTPPNGRFDMCAESTTSYLFDIDTPAHVDAIAYFEVEALQARMLSFRSWTLARAAQFYTSFGLTYDATRAHVLVFAAGDRSNLTLNGAAHGTVLAGNDDAAAGTYTWAAGASGRYVLFPNVAIPIAGTVMVIGDVNSGPHTVPIAAGKITLVAASWVFL